VQRPVREKAIRALLIGAAGVRKCKQEHRRLVAIEMPGTIERAVEIASHAAGLAP